jgi:hypothetical protein
MKRSLVLTDEAARHPFRRLLPPGTLTPIVQQPAMSDIKFFLRHFWFFGLAAFNSHCRLEQPMQMRDKEAHFGVVDGFLCSAPPSLFGALIIGENADDLNCAVIKIQRTRVPDATTEDEM